VDPLCNILFFPYYREDNILKGTTMKQIKFLLTIQLRIIFEEPSMGISLARKMSGSLPFNDVDNEAKTIR